MNAAKAMQCQKQIEMIAVLVREMPLAEFVADHTTGGVSTAPAYVAHAMKLLELQKMLPPSPVTP